MPSKLVLSGEDHDKIRVQAKLQGTEDYSVVTHRVHGRWLRSIHVFERLPTQKELTDYENTASKLKFRGQGKATLEGGSITASVTLYAIIIARVYDLPVGDTTIPLLDKAEAKIRVNPLTKREALRDLVGGVFSESMIAEREGEDEVQAADKEDD